MARPYQTLENLSSVWSYPAAWARRDDFLRREACNPFTGLLRPFLTGLHGEAVESAAAMDLHSPGIP